MLDGRRREPMTADKTPPFDPPPPAIAERLRDALALHRQGRVAAAEAAYHAILADAPGQFDALHLAGVAAFQRGGFQEADRLIGAALADRPGNPDALNNRGLVLAALGRNAEALACYDAALAARPAYAQALHNRGDLQRTLRRPEAALASYDAALALAPDNLAVLNNRGNTLFGLRRFEAALASYDRALALRPEHADVQNNRGGVLLAMKRYPEAADAFAALLARHPRHVYAAGSLFRARLRCCDWTDYAAAAARLAEAVAAGEPVDDPYSFLLHTGDANLQLRCAARYAAREFPAAPDPAWRGERYAHDRIRVAYLAAEFQDHATAFLMAGLFERHDRARFEIFAISFGPDADDAMRRRLRPAFDFFISVAGRTDREVALLLREREIDIAVDLKGYTGDNRTGIFAQRAAPVQVNYLGYPGTMGVDYIDYILADACVIPPELEPQFSERVVRLPDSYQVNDARRAIDPRTPTRAEVGLPDAGFVFCCFNNNYKITPAVFDVWMRLLLAVEGSVLWLLQDNEAATGNLRREAVQRDVAAGRLVFAPRVAQAAHLARHRLADLALDTLPVNAHTTASDALWAGLPLVTCTGSAFAGRVATSVLHAAGMPDLVTGSLADYEALALRLARDRDTLAAIQARLAANREHCPLFDTDRTRRHIEAAYITMWQRQQRGEAPEPFSVAADPG